MNLSVRLQLILATIVIALLAVTIVWASLTTHRAVGAFEDQFKSVEINSFRIADRLQVSVVELRSLVLQHLLFQDSGNVEEFERKSQELGQWLDEQKQVMEAPKERTVLLKIEKEYERYLSETRPVLESIEGSGEESIRATDLKESVSASIELLNLGFQLATAHRGRVELFLNGAERSVSRLQMLVFVSLFLLLLLGVWISVIIYRHFLAPLRVQLTESVAQLENQEKLAALGLLAAGVAHEIRNPLAAIKACLFLQRKRLEPNTPEYRDGDNIGKEISRLENIVTEVLQFARPSEPRFEVVEASGPLRQVVGLMQADLESSGVHLKADDTDVGQIKIDRHHIEQVLINLVRNAAESTGPSGEISLRARPDVHPGIGDVVVLEVRDNGPGISEELQARLFDPFFSTKETGTGLGLSIASRIVQKNNGRLVCESTPGRGATFQIVLPAVS